MPWPLTLAPNLPRTKVPSSARRTPAGRDARRGRDGGKVPLKGFKRRYEFILAGWGAAELRLAASAAAAVKGSRGGGGPGGVDLPRRHQDADRARGRLK